MKQLLIASFLCGSFAASNALAQCSSSKTARMPERVAVVKGMTVDQQVRKDIVDTAVAAGSFKTLATALTRAGLVDALKGDGPFTVFAPTDEAFAKLPKGTLETLLKPENKDQLTAILTYHVVSGKVPAAQAVKLSNAGTLNGQQIDLQVRDGSLRIDNATVITADIECSNGVIHVIDNVILPSSKDVVATAVEAGTFKTLAAALEAGGLVSTLQGDGPFTVFAPTDEAFAKLPAGTVESLLKPENKDKLVAILSYHVVSGRQFAADVLKAGTFDTLQGSAVKFRTQGKSAFANDAKIVATNIDASNGVIHVIDTVLMPPSPQQGNAANELIEFAIERGAPLFNAGRPEACFAVYEVAARGLLSMENLSAHSVHRLNEAIRSAHRTHDNSRRAWILREALDDVYGRM